MVRILTCYLFDFHMKLLPVVMHSQASYTLWMF